MSLCFAPYWLKSDLWSMQIPDQAAYYHDLTSSTALVENETGIMQHILKIE